MHTNAHTYSCRFFPVWRAGGLLLSSINTTRMHRTIYDKFIATYSGRFVFFRWPVIDAYFGMPDGYFAYASDGR